jgi:hypothetical protein
MIEGMAFMLCYVMFMFIVEEEAKIWRGISMVASW